ncbi:VP80 [Rachiplusia nu nucleopolyhedrovirus]|uniref:VP80 n=1 Tax=Rachiplusia nu nucleopolyhedrovirus TaxID=2605775 RepID=A0AAE6IRC9_9ABAC|nr:VP80 [Rachiplusia nu nucleopolyhedrovirus]QEI03618.1 VP80 [Rachiplusia nu nucleopolyhedrovirus]
MNVGADETIKENSFRIKFTYAETLYKYLKFIRPEEQENLTLYRKRLDDLSDDRNIAKFTLDNLVRQMHNLLIYVTPGPSRNIVPSATSVTTANLVFTARDDFDMIKLYITNLLRNETLRPLSYHSLTELEQKLHNKSELYAEDFLTEIRLDAKDCDQNTLLQTFLATYRNYGVAECVDTTNLRYYVELLRDSDRSQLPPTVAEALNIIIYNIDSPYKIQVSMDKTEYLSLTGSQNNDLRALFNRYNEITPIKFTSKDTTDLQITRTTTKRRASDNAPLRIESSSSDEMYDRETIVNSGAASVISTADSSRDSQKRKRRRKKIRKSTTASSSAATSSAETSREQQEISASNISSSTTLPTTTGSTNVPTEIFIENVKQTMKPNMALPLLLRYIVQIVPDNIDKSLMTCPSAHLNSMVSSVNYLNKLDIIKNMNLAGLSKRAYFYELLEPLALYGSKETDVLNIVWFITVSGTYFEKSAEHFREIRSSLVNRNNNALKPVIEDPDRVAIFIIKYNFLWHYRQFISKLMSSPIKPFGDERALKVLRVFDLSVRKNFESIPLKFNENKIYSGPVSDIVKLMNAQITELV